MAAAANAKLLANLLARLLAALQTKSARKQQNNFLTQKSQKSPRYV